MIDFFNKKFVSQNVLTLLFVIYLILGLNTPKPIAQLVDTLLGKIVIIILAIYWVVFLSFGHSLHSLKLGSVLFAKGL